MEVEEKAHVGDCVHVWIPHRIKVICVLFSWREVEDLLDGRSVKERERNDVYYDPEDQLHVCGDRELKERDQDYDLKHIYQAPEMLKSR